MRAVGDTLYIYADVKTVAVQHFSYLPLGDDIRILHLTLK